MRTSICALLAILFLTGTLHSKTPEERTLVSLVHAVRLYSSQRNDTPKSWLAMEQFGFERTLKDGREILDIENRYFFPGIETELTSRFHSKMLIILMAKSPGEEGNIQIYKSPTSFQPTEGRFVIFKNIESGEIESGRISEVELSTIFKNKGIRLEEFTFDKPLKPSPKQKSESRIDSRQIPSEFNSSTKNR
jgi:hypothetical protein